MEKIRTAIKKAVAWFMASNRYKHFIGGFTVGLFGMNAWTALYAAVAAASCLELKDMLYGNRWDWTDWSVTAIGGCVTALFYLCL